MPRGERGGRKARKKGPSAPAAASTAHERAEPGFGKRLRWRMESCLEVMIIPAFIVVPIVVIFLIGISPQFISLLHRETVTDTVVKSERVNNGESGKYLVFGKNEVYQNTDSWPLRKFRSSDFYRDIEVGKTYRFTVVGWRIPLFSTYRNIVEFEEVAPGTE